MLRNYQSTDLVLTPAVSLEGKDFQDNINIRHTPLSATGGSVTAQQVLDELTNAGAIIKLSENVTEDIQGNKGIKLVYTMTLQELDLSVISYIIPARNTYYITCTSLPEHFPPFRKTCETIAKSFQILQD